jgi:5-methylcytosine-specific restriction endonuclease McrA
MHRPGQRFCSKSCKTAWQNGARPPYDRHTLVGLPRKRRHDRIWRQRRAETWDGVADAEILERDRWRCGICRKAIGKSFKWPHPKSASIDHIVPISEGGADTAGNKRAAHLGCNGGRCNRGGGEQAALF